jgi:hypothetical protein
MDGLQWLAVGVAIGIVLGCVIPEAMELVRDYRKGRA